jgi:hypothetical protein
MGTMSTTTKASTAANVPIAMMNTRGGANMNEIYVDIGSCSVTLATW